MLKKEDFLLYIFGGAITIYMIAYYLQSRTKGNATSTMQGIAVGEINPSNPYSRES